MTTSSDAEREIKKLQEAHWRSLAKGRTAAFVPFILSIAAWFLYDSVLKPAACAFKESSLLLSLWPYNFIYFDQFRTSRFAPDDTCWFFATVSTSSAFWVCFLIWQAARAYSRGESTAGIEAMRKTLPGLEGMTLLSGGGVLLLGAVLLFGFSTSSSFRGLSLTQSIGTGAFKLLFVVMPMFFVAAGWTIEFNSLRRQYERRLYPSSAPTKG